MSDLYAERDIWELPMYEEHVSAMTREGLHAKSAIAAELAYRDDVIAKQSARLAKLEEENQNLKSELSITGNRTTDQRRSRSDLDGLHRIHPAREPVGAGNYWRN